MKKLTFFLFICASFALSAQTIEEKKASLVKSESGLDPLLNDDLAQVNLILEEKHSELEALFAEGEALLVRHASEEEYKELVSKVKEIKKEIKETEKMWRKEMASGDGYALWHQPEATLSQLMMDYGAGEFVYIIPPEIAAIPLSINSNLPIPREAWEECLELILNQNGIGIRELNPFLRELYLLKIDTSYLKCITDKESELDLMASNDRICFVLSTENLDPRVAMNFLQKFSNPSTTSIMMIRSEIFIVATADSIKELLKLYEFVKSGRASEEYQLVTLTKVDSGEMQSIIESAFQTGEETLRVIPLSSVTQSLFLYGTKDEIVKAVKLVRDVESKIENAKAKTVFWYTTKHSEAEDLATVLAKVYDLLVEAPSSGGASDKRAPEFPGGRALPPAPPPPDGASLAGPTPVVEPSKVTPLASGRIAHGTSDGQNNFIVDPKTGSIIMVVEQEALPKIKELLKKLDVPKKMVQIEVLLFEKKCSNQNKTGLNLLKIGSAAKDVTTAALSWGSPAGILEFLISRGKGSGIPAFDIAYSFLLGQEDVQINASPSVTTVNQTPATIAIVDEISINTGADTEKGDKGPRNVYQRAQYGITIQITPTINMGEVEGEEHETGFITLDTDITFDTTKKSSNDRPDVTRRHIKNHVIIPDGQTVILGGLRRKSVQDAKESIPFLGEIPGLGKLFSTTQMYDDNSEMFIFITPKIIADHHDDIEKIRKDELKKRPGDVPEFIHELLQAKEREKKRFFAGSLNALFGRGGTFTTPIPAHQEEYDGR